MWSGGRSSFAIRPNRSFRRPKFFRKGDLHISLVRTHACPPRGSGFPATRTGGLHKPKPIGQGSLVIVPRDIVLFGPPLDLLSDASLFLDFDGTLVEMAETPDAVRVDARLSAVMHRLHDRLDGRMAVITGRPATQIRALLAADFVVVGSHGMEFAEPGGTGSRPQRPAALDTALQAMRALAERHPGVLVEDKPFGAALHYRQCPSAEPNCTRLASDLAERHGLQLQPGKMMVEVRAAGGDKGTAIRTLMREPAMAGTRPVFMGDDHTDEPGFVAAAELGGVGVLVGQKRETAALYRLEGVEATLAWLEAASAEAE